MTFSTQLRSFRGRLRGVICIAVAAFLSVGPLAPQRVLATITTLGNVTPAPPAGGGNINATFIVGDSSYGQLSVTSSTPATPISVIGANNAVFGDDARVTGSGAFTGFGSNFTIARDLLLGNAGSGNLSVSGLARVTATEDIVLGVLDGSSGRLFVNDLATVVEALDNVIVGQSGTALVQVLSGSRVFAENTTVGSNATSDGTVTVSGNETLWLQTGTMTVGASGRGFLQVVSQGRMETTNALIGTAAAGVGIANVSGTGSVWEVTGTMTLGVAGQASLEVNQGGRLTSTGATRLATLATSDASALVSGVNSVWNTGPSLTIGELGTGVLRIVAGGRVNSGNAALATTADGTARGEVVVDGVGTMWDVTGTLDVGGVSGAEALLTVSSGGVVATSGLARVGAAGEIFMAGGRLNVFGTGLTNQGVVRGAGRINGTITNSASGEIRTQATGTMVLGDSVTNAGLISLDGGEMEILGVTTNSGDIDACDAVVRFGGGLNNNNNAQLAIVGGDVDVFGNISNGVGGQVVVGGEATAVFHDAFTNNGQLHIMPGADVLMLENLSFGASSLLNFQLNSGALGQDFSPLEVAGQATLAGELKLQLTGGLAPELGDSFQVVTATGGVSGTFGTETLPALGAGLAWDLDYEPTSLTLSVVAGPGLFAADFNGDGRVDGEDLAAWRIGFGTSPLADKDDGDADDDGDVDGADFLTWQRELGSGVPAAPAAGAIPEPSTALLLAVALVGLASTSRRRAR